MLKVSESKTFRTYIFIFYLVLIHLLCSRVFMITFKVNENFDYIQAN